MTVFTSARLAVAGALTQTVLFIPLLAPNLRSSFEVKALAAIFSSIPFSSLIGYAREFVCYRIDTKGECGSSVEIIKSASLFSLGFMWGLRLDRGATQLFRRVTPLFNPFIPPA